MDRRDFLRIAALASAGFTLSGCTTLHYANSKNDANARRQYLDDLMSEEPQLAEAQKTGVLSGLYPLPDAEKELLAQLQILGSQIGLTKAEAQATAAQELAGWYKNNAIATASTPKFLGQNRLYGRNLPIPVVIYPDAWKTPEKEMRLTLAEHELTHARDVHFGARIEDMTITLEDITTGKIRAQYLDIMMELRANGAEIRRGLEGTRCEYQRQTLSLFIQAYTTIQEASGSQMPSLLQSYLGTGLAGNRANNYTNLEQEASLRQIKSLTDLHTTDKPIPMVIQMRDGKEQHLIPYCKQN